MTSGCTIGGCGKKILARRMCGMHYQRWRLNGDPEKRQRVANGESKVFADTVAATYKGDDCLIWPFPRDRDGYGRIGSRTASNYVCEIVHGAAPTGVHVGAAHSCGNGNIGCVNPRHLSWKEQRDNAQDTVTHGKTMRGTKHPLAKLTPEQVVVIRAKASTATFGDLARQFSVSPALIRSIVSRQQWAWLPQPLGIKI